MRIRNEVTDKGVMVIIISGQLDIDESMELVRYLRDSDAWAYVIDLSAVTYIGSTGVGTIVDLRRRRKKRVAVVIPDGHSPVALVVQTVNLGSILPVVTSIDEALHIIESS